MVEFIFGKLGVWVRFLTLLAAHSYVEAGRFGTASKGRKGKQCEKNEKPGLIGAGLTTWGRQKC